ncbi:ATP-binding cassette domain-containing protein [Brucella intermedia]|uniref:ATP-binding cassette domain-containing protein n=1 Tax=Brucella intermedia TaxID=94625 RepID=UPI00124EA153|nr:ABC transporter ATP-binding protein [Brucella intermedia]KAB2723398.1 ABC transporter ATP-binding protein [Brucella intermedia]
MTLTPEPLLEVTNLSLQYRTTAGPIPILHDISVSLGKGEILGVIGESGAGKSTLGNAVLGMLGPRFEQSSGSIIFGGRRLGRNAGSTEFRSGKIAAIFQDHTASLDPLMSIGRQLNETIRVSDKALSRQETRTRGIELLRRVGIPAPESRYDDYPHQFSGGQRQRIVIAMAIAGSPDLIIADEPTSALDATVQKQILLLLRRLVDETGVSIILVTHDMGVIAEIADKVLVMRHGRAVEQDVTAGILDTPRSEYTRKLIAAVPRLRISRHASITRPDSTPYKSDNPEVSDDQPPVSFLIARGVSRTFGAIGLPWPFSKAPPLQALDNVSITLRRGGITGIIGESGSGKTTMGRILTGLQAASAGKLIINDTGFDLSRSGDRNGLLGRVQMIFQDPSTSLNPRMTIGQTLLEAARFARNDTGNSCQSELERMLDRLGLARSFLTRHPHQLSGGQKQRVCIARALLARPHIIVADEPTSALDVSVQAEIISLLKETVSMDGVSMIFISHDLAVVQDICDFIYIFKDGRVEDAGSSETIFSHSQNAYTRSLVNARSERFIQ